MKVYYPEGRLFDTAENKRHLSGPTALAQAAVNQTVLEARVLLCDAGHNLTVDLGCMKGIIPREEGALGIAEGTTRDIALISRVGRAVSFTVTELSYDENGRPIALLSRRHAQELCRAEFLAHQHIGDVIEVTVTHLENFGAFCDVGCGNVALLPIDAISVSRISHPSDRFHVGQTIRAVIKNISPDGKITLTHKELLGTWEENVSRFAAGQTVSGVIRSVENYGIFVELTPNLAGLAEPHEQVIVGQQAGVYIKSILPEKMKIKLIIIDSFDAVAPQAPHYYFEGNHLDEWQYSPKECPKKIQSFFR
ncbi:MAG: 30S ribosomal protein S1 [Clostridia bacterium]|nr:30S ribosomal protein S1 [Clostridia bacterium]